MRYSAEYRHESNSPWDHHKTYQRKLVFFVDIYFLQMYAIFTCFKNHYSLNFSLTSSLLKRVFLEYQNK